MLKAKGAIPGSAFQVQQVPPPSVPLGNTVDNETRPDGVPPPTRVGTATTSSRVKSCARLTRSKSPTRPTKRKRASGSHLDSHSEDIPTESDTDGGIDGDGSSSGDSIHSDDPAPTKRPRIHTTRSSTRTTTPNTTSHPVLINTATLPSDPVGPQSPTALTEPMDVGDVSNDSHRGEGETLSSPLFKPERDPQSENDAPSATASVDSTTNPKSTESGHSTGPISMTDSQFTITTPPASLPTPIDPLKVPGFLRSHGKGNRKVDIFKYLNKVEDPFFQQVLLNYLKFEINDKSGITRLLPTANRPPEIVQWTSRARPDNLPDLSKSKRTFSMFVGSTLAWWGSLQPSWRSFQPGVVSREVKGGWEDLYAPRINGLLNIVILVYWWCRILEEQKPKDGVRTDYEFFADDVSWVFSHLST